MASIPPGWYPDNLNAANVRWWDGTQWTAHTRSATPGTPKPTPQTPGAFQTGGLHRAAAAEDQTTVSSEQPPPAVAPARETEQPPKVTFFNAKGHAHRLQEEASDLRTELDELKAWIRENGIRSAVDALRVEKEAKERISQAEDEAEELLRQKERALEAKRAETENEIASLRRDVDRIEAEARSKRGELASLVKELIDVRTRTEFQDLALFDFEHPAESSVQIKAKLDAVRREYKDIIRRKKAARTTTGFRFNDSAAQGKKFLDNMTKLLLGAYNSEAENVAKAVSASNLESCAKRLSTARDRIERQGSMIDFHVDENYHRMRLTELELAAEHLQVKALEKELERERKAELREQKKVESELLAQREKLLKEQSHYENLLNSLKERGDADGIARVESQLSDVQTAIDDVDYRQANTRAGYVYVISNRGAFGPDVVKIGMTRRLEPMDRVRELGDASVPFRFDVHALFFSQDAVGVESDLHRKFEKQRLNMVNLRREFFRVSPDQVLEALQNSAVEVVEFTLEAPAEEHSQSLTIAERLQADVHVSTRA